MAESDYVAMCELAPFWNTCRARGIEEDEEALRQIRRSLSEEIINELCTRLTHLGMDREEIRAAVDAWASGNFLSAESEKETKPERELSPENEIKPKES